MQNLDHQAALRGLLQAVRDTLEVPLPASGVDHEAQRVLQSARAATVRIMIAGLLEGPLDYVAVQEAARVLRAVLADLPVTYTPYQAPQAVGS